MLHIRSPERYRVTQRPSLFLAGGITGCPDWQRSAERLLRNSPGILLNPRREQWPDCPEDDLERTQVQWEHEYLMSADAHAFFFPPDTFCPITLFELGKILIRQKPLFVAIDPGYKKRKNVVIQLSIVRPEVKIVPNIDLMARQVQKWIHA